MSYNSIDDLRVARNAFYTGNYAGCLRELESVPHGTPYVDIFRARAQAMLNPASVESIPDTASAALQSIRTFVRSISTSADAERSQPLFDLVNGWLNDPNIRRDGTVLLHAAYMHLYRGSLKPALELVSYDSKNNLEKLAVKVQVLLAMNRHDIASSIVDEMATVDDDDVLYQLAQTWVLIAKSSPESLAAATTNATELIEKYGQTAPLLSLLASTLLLQGKHREAFQHLRTAREISRQAGSPVSLDTFINSAVCMFHRGSATPAADEVLGKVVSELKTTYPKCSFTTDMASMEEAFDKCAAEYA